MAKKIRIYYRAPSHVPLWKVMEECGFLNKHGLEMEMGSLEGQRKRAAEGLKAGDLDVVSGNHHNLYARKALYGDPYVHIAQSNNSWRENFLVCGKGVNGLQDLKGKKVVMDDFDGHTGLNVWLYLRQHGLEEGRDVELVENGKKGAERAREVMEGKYDASFIRAVDRLRALKFGAKIIELPSMAMIEGVTLTTTTTYVQSHEEECRALIMAVVIPAYDDPADKRAFEAISRVFEGRVGVQVFVADIVDGALGLSAITLAQPEGPPAPPLETHEGGTAHIPEMQGEAEGDHLPNTHGDLIAVKGRAHAGARSTLQATRQATCRKSRPNGLPFKVGTAQSAAHLQ